jgi:hypothetical protein
VDESVRLICQVVKGADYQITALSTPAHQEALNLDAFGSRCFSRAIT